MSGIAEGVERWSEQTRVRPGHRERVEALMRDRWREPVIVLHFGDTDVGYDVPGRRRDGTVEGKRLVRRFFWNILRGIGAAVFGVFALAHGERPGLPFQRVIGVSGPENAMALDLADRLRSVKGAWLACSPSCLAVVDTGPTTTDPADAPPPRIVWEARKPQAPELSFRKSTLTWPDGSIFRLPVQGRTEQQHLRKFVEFPDVIHWNGR
ncbi:hypothetical protein [Amycolatopsis sp. DG1A-15b]|uniref:hypothetical protein n=1 Tax=Amycolatopsis sp. DG1A-15b TaxID=3052846 RepID=UPI00255B7842|nr:hypothetical protein [Amycolatopsis sp. DG1A-15b]WIX90721.1 hypothetical protein QRY02_09930 [Amycolatopsis sp. DG1A-15b]